MLTLTLFDLLVEIDLELLPLAEYVFGDDREGVHR